ncbi:NUDIX hydrolase [Coprinopsis cinerea AmutBmut pab1-1]|nr:NUDIX hydrolase [Coprinopsis cinerea AmutBmut pab1-1]
MSGTSAPILDTPVSETTTIHINQLEKALKQLKLYTDNQEGPHKEFLDTYPKLKQAAVLALLLELPHGENGKLYVILTTRGKNLRTHGGQTSLPGGKRDVNDVDIIHTAYREAHEEIGLPLPGHLSHICTACWRCSGRDSPDNSSVNAKSTPGALPQSIRTLGTLPPLPFHSLLVTPVIAYASRPDLLLPILKPNPGEVNRIFLHPLENILDPKPTTPISEVGLGMNARWADIQFGEVMPPSELVLHGSEYWPYEMTYHIHKDYVFNSPPGLVWRDHHFQTCASPITGMTADVLVSNSVFRLHPESIMTRSTRSFPSSSSMFPCRFRPPDLHTRRIRSLNDMQMARSEIRQS